MSLDLNKKLEVAVQAAKLGREVLLKYQGKLTQVQHKFQAGLVTEADKESEKAIFAHLKAHFPEDQFLGEESAPAIAQTKPLVQGGQWIVDPLDGTTNYVHQFPVYCVSIGYQYNGVTQIAVIDVPRMNEVYTAIRGQGSFVNGQKMQVSQTSKLEDCLSSTGFFNEIEPRLQEQLRIFEQLVRKLQAVRRAGASAYDLCLVARGVFDVYWEKGLQPWDSCAGQLLVEEAGGQVVTFHGKVHTPFSSSLVAGNALVTRPLQQLIQPLADPDLNP
jgi:myo-inositol-1(or 4)-monophosphatase